MFLSLSAPFHRVESDGSTHLDKTDWFRLSAPAKNEHMYHRQEALATLEKEEKVFRSTLGRGLRELDKMVKTSKNNTLNGIHLFKLQDTYGFPLELSIEEAYKEGITLSKDYKDEKVRRKYGFLCGIVGIILNISMENRLR